MVRSTPKTNMLHHFSFSQEIVGVHQQHPSSLSNLYRSNCPSQVTRLENNQVEFQPHGLRTTKGQTRRSVLPGQLAKSSAAGGWKETAMSNTKKLDRSLRTHKSSACTSDSYFTGSQMKAPARGDPKNKKKKKKNRAPRGAQTKADKQISARVLWKRYSLEALSHLLPAYTWTATHDPK